VTKNEPVPPQPCRASVTSRNFSKSATIVRSVHFGITFTVLFGLLCLWVKCCDAQSEALTSKDVSPIEASRLTVRKEVREVNLVMTVTDRRGHFVNNLTPKDMLILDNGQPPKHITYFENQTNLPLRVALVIDTSASVNKYFDQERMEAYAFLEHTLRPDSDLALIIRFNQQSYLVQSPTGDRRLLSEAIHVLSIGGTTAIYDAAAVASQKLSTIKDSRPCRRAIILMTDGEDNSSQLTLQDAAKISQQNESIIFVLDGADEHSRMGMAANAMRQLAELTGGQFLHANNEKRIMRAFSTIEQDLRNQYAIGYTPANFSADGLFHHILVSTPKKLLIHYRQGYLAK
jgi:Ca-activated chloride channel family protein